MNRTWKIFKLGRVKRFSRNYEAKQGSISQTTSTMTFHSRQSKRFGGRLLLKQ